MVAGVKAVLRQQSGPARRSAVNQFVTLLCDQAWEIDRWSGPINSAEDH